MRRALRVFLIGIPALALVAVGGLALVLPKLAAARLAERAQSRHGLTMTVDGGAGFSFADGLGVTLRNVSFTQSSQQGVPLLVVGEIKVPAPLGQLLGGGLKRLTLVDPVFAFVAADTKNPPEGEDTGEAEPQAPKDTVRPLAVTIENGAIKASDPVNHLAFSVTDISGSVSQSGTGALDADLRGLFNGVASQLALAIDDVRRLEQRGSPSDVTLTSKAGQVIMSGRLRLTGTLQFDGSVSAEAQDAQSFLSWLGVPLSGLSDGLTMGLDAGLSIADSKARFRNLAFALGDMQARGEVSIQAASPRPAVDATLSFNTVNFNIYGDNTGSSAAEPPNLNRDWREERLPFSDLKAADMALSVTTESFTAGAVTGGPSSLKANLKDGQLQARLESSDLFSGKGTLDLALADGEEPALKLALDVAGVTAREFLGKAFGISFLSGPLSLKADMAARGTSPAQLVSTLSGTTDLSLRDGRIDGIDLATLAGVVSRNDAQGWGIAAGQATAFAEASARASFSDGIAALSNSTIRASGLAASVDGTVDLLRRAVDLKVTPGEGLALPVAARVKGPWNDPRISAKVDVDQLLDKDTQDGLKDAASEILGEDATKSAKKALKKLLGD